MYIHMSYFKYQGKKVYYEERGVGTPLLLLHGNTASSRMFDEVISLYEKDFRVILIDFLGHGNSDRLDSFPDDLWFDEAQQVILLLKERQYGKVDIIGSSGGALVAINVALEAPDLVGSVVADSFEGEQALKVVADFLRETREQSKFEEASRMFYYTMHGEDYEGVVDNDTRAALQHEKTIKNFFHQPLQKLQSNILFTGSRQDDFIALLSPTYFEDTYKAMITKIGHGEYHLFDYGDHPAMLSNSEAFYEIVKVFLRQNDAQ